MRNPCVKDVLGVGVSEGSPDPVAALLAALTSAGVRVHTWEQFEARGVPDGCVAVGIPDGRFVRLGQARVPIVAVLADGVLGPSALLALCGGFVPGWAPPAVVLRAAATARCAPWALVTAAVRASRDVAAPRT